MGMERKSNSLSILMATDCGHVVGKGERGLPLQSSNIGSFHPTTQPRLEPCTESFIVTSILALRFYSREIYSSTYSPEPSICIQRCFRQDSGDVCTPLVRLPSIQPVNHYKRRVTCKKGPRGGKSTWMILETVLLLPGCPLDLLWTVRV